MRNDDTLNNYAKQDLTTMPNNYAHPKGSGCGFPCHKKIKRNLTLRGGLVECKPLHY